MSRPAGHGVAGHGAGRGSRSISSRLGPRGPEQPRSSPLLPAPLCQPPLPFFPLKPLDRQSRSSAQVTEPAGWPLRFPCHVSIRFPCGGDSVTGLLPLVSSPSVGVVTLPHLPPSGRPNWSLILKPMGQALCTEVTWVLWDEALALFPARLPPRCPVHTGASGPLRINTRSCDRPPSA